MVDLSIAMLVITRGYLKSFKIWEKMALHLDRPWRFTRTQAVCCIELVTEGRYTEILPRFSCSQEITDLFQEENTSQLLSAVQDSMGFRFDIHVSLMGLAWFVPCKIWVVPPKPPFHLISWYWLGARSVRPWWWVKRLWTLGSGLVASCSCPWPHFFSDVSRPQEVWEWSRHLLTVLVSDSTNRKCWIWQSKLGIQQKQVLGFTWFYQKMCEFRNRFANKTSGFNRGKCGIHQKKYGFHHDKWVFFHQSLGISPSF